MDGKLIGVTAVAIVFLIAAASLGYMYSSVTSSYNSLKSKYNILNQNLTQTKNEINSLSGELSSLNSSYNNLHNEFLSLNSSYTSLNSAYKQIISQYNNQQPNVVLSLAMSHWNDIAIENASLVIQQYAPNAVLHWIGGPLTGNYTGIQQINATWSKFNSLYEYVVWYSLVPPTVVVHGTSAMVYAPLQFVVFPFPTSSNPTPHELVLNVTEELYYSYNSSITNWQLSNEYWIVHPIPISDVAPGYTGSVYNATS
ncbi:hypothetical protein [Caldisphaera sp.]|uniref:hypothetical protein n=1 Tax=Caldisphaera sp. TaxID=2060322 RepID=UPI0025C42394|nr:hypothetical protein [Caldisphaera sp.]